MKTFLSIAVLIALAAMMVLSFAPADLVGVRSGFSSFAGVTTAVALLAVAVAGAWVWLRDGRHRDD